MDTFPFSSTRAAACNIQVHRAMNNITREALERAGMKRGIVIVLGITITGA